MLIIKVIKGVGTQFDYNFILCFPPYASRYVDFGVCIYYVGIIINESNKK